MYRKAEEDDCKIIYELICGMEKTELPYESFQLIFQKQLADEDYYCLVYENENGVAGVLNLRFEEQLHHCGRIAEVMEFAVAPSCRNMGIGKKMLAHACQIAKDCNCTQIEVACNRLREDTHRFYLREGMNNYHYKFSKSLTGDCAEVNRIGI